MKFIIQIFSNALAILIAAYLIPGFVFQGNVTHLVLAGLALGLINFFVRPILKFFTAPVLVLTLGLFSIAINAFLLWLVTLIVPALEIQGILAYLLGVLVIGAVNFFISTLSRPFFRKQEQKKES